MTHFIELTVNIKKSYKLAEAFNSSFRSIHNQLVKTSLSEVGLSFPDYGEYLGHSIRLHGTAEQLSVFHGKSWLGQHALTIHHSDIQPIPTQVSHATFSRVQQNQSASKLRRFISRNQPTDEQIRAYKAKMHQSGLQEPFVELKSSSTEQLHRIYIRKEMKDSAQAGSFTSYGLSKDGSTVPVF